MSWNYSESDKKYYERQSAYEDKRKRFLRKVENRGRVATEWFNAGNKLTKETQPEFNKLMKIADKEFEEKILTGDDNSKK